MFEIAGRTVDLSGVLPLRVGDWKALKNMGVTTQTLSSGDIEAVATLAYYVLHKADPSITQADVDNLLPQELGKLGDVISESERVQPDRPT